MGQVTLSFDNGPDAEATPAVLDALAARGLKSTFFVLGKKLATPQGRALAERAHADGHWIGAHSWSHETPLGLDPDPEAPEREIGRTHAEIGALAHPDRLFRPFGGGGHLDRRLLSPAAADYLQRGGYSCVLWNAVPRDWIDPDGWVETALSQCAALPWSVVVLHDLPTACLRRLDDFLDGLERSGAQVRQDFPPDCTPILRGEVLSSIEAYVSA